MYANPSRFPQTHLIAAGVQQVLAEKEEIFAADVPASKDVATTVEYINQCLNGGRAIPQAIITQLACCLVAAEVCADMVEARMIVDQIF
ncbi:glycosyl transferase family protein [compost metagenome]